MHFKVEHQGHSVKIKDIEAQLNAHVWYFKKNNRNSYSHEVRCMCHHQTFQPQPCHQRTAHITLRQLLTTHNSQLNINKYASFPDWRNPHMPIAVTASGGQFVTRASRLPGQFVAPGYYKFVSQLCSLYPHKNCLFCNFYCKNMCTSIHSHMHISSFLAAAGP